MNELAKTYSPSEVEDKWYSYWMEHDLFKSVPDEREPYTIVIPPPNVTGILHMGHMLNNTIQDILIRRARMEGKNALWVPGTDHAAIATEAKVVAKLAKDGIKKSDLSREEFLRHAWEWKEKYGGTILEQLKKIGASCDWSRTAFTMDDVRSESVIKVFCELYRKGLIYRGKRMVNWDPKACTALSDIEVVYKEEHSKLYYLRYRIVGEDGYAIVATTRPETIMGDTAMCINPKDPKNQHLRGKKVIVPLVNREIPVIEDDYVDIEFGTGCLKVTPAHDMNDNMLGQKHNLETIDIFNDNGTISEAAGMYVGMDRFDVRKQIAVDLQNAGLVEKIEEYQNKVGYSERNIDTVVEPRLSDQWFLKMDDISKPAHKAVMEDFIKFVPEKFKNTYNTWMSEIKDWCISRQLWWGHRIPAYYLPDGSFVVAETPEKALEEAMSVTGNSSLTVADLRQDDDCLDTWFSSWLWPVSLFNGILEPGNEEISYYYPTTTLVTGPDIIFFWVARMIIAGYEFVGDMPFKNVYFTGIVRDNIGRKMSKQFGNSPDPLDLIAKYGADGVRMGLMLAAPAGNDVFYDDKLVEQGRNFCNKIWNAFRLVKGWSVADKPQPESAVKAVDWFKSQLDATLAEVSDLFGKFRLSEALMAIYRLFWDEFSSWYLEMVKPAYGEPVDKATYEATLNYFDTLLRMLHPFMPFITEELWQHLQERKPGDSIMYAQLPAVGDVDAKSLEAMAHAKEVIVGVRGVRAAKNISPREALVLNVIGDWDDSLDAVVKKLGNLSAINAGAEKDAAAATFMVGTVEFNVPLTNNIDVDAELARLNKELDYYRGFLASVMKKLGNERFVNNAPEAVVAAERNKQKDAESKIATIEASIKALEGK
ncbi:valine--tRNA ligase [Barnesiella sp. WM24]|uniref:valine--tRNA ligase n=1 Tax=Barnesiella sp. WM24 TaxID=2558278 RepID=UPI00107250D1|nr:valine--tRNA ligase [Barnesiella sp. WM24]MDE6113955.1 valine--tRNA ligase [Muribaculum sp.]TFU92685.1 valine--tRNA ligase [Barnesiella sp. WM24]